MPRAAVAAPWIIAIVFAALASPASAQFSDHSSGFHFFPFYNSRPQPQQQWQWWQPQQQPPSEQRVIDYSKAPPPRKLDTSPTMHVVVMGDAMADWLAYGLEDAFGDTPEIGVVRKQRANSGLIHSESKNAYDWPQAAREILATDKPDFIVMMIGLGDRQSIRERPARTSPPTKPGDTKQANPQDAKQDTKDAKQDTKQDAKQATASAPVDPAAQEVPPGEEGARVAEQPPVAAPEPTRGGPTSSATYEFRSEKWAELYAKRIDEMIAVLKSKGVPVFWVGLPAMRGTRSTADMAYLNDLYRSRAEKAGIVYVDVWDGFVDEDGNFTVQGPDFEGQTRRLRSGDGVYFTKAGARKLAHYAEREIEHTMLAKGTPMAVPQPEEPQSQGFGGKPGAPARPVAGPVVPLTVPGGEQDGLLGGPSRPPAVDQTTTRVLVKGEPLPSLAGRADDFAWPRGDGSTPAPSASQSEPAATKVETPTAAKPEPPAQPKAAAPAAAPATSPPAGPKPPARPSAAPPAPPKRTGQADATDLPAHRPPQSSMSSDAPRPPGSIPSR